jgi:hypothetical protein
MQYVCKPDYARYDSMDRLRILAIFTRSRLLEISSINSRKLASLANFLMSHFF